MITQAVKTWIQDTVSMSTTTTSGWLGFSQVFPNFFSKCAYIKLGFNLSMYSKRDKGKDVKKSSETLNLQAD